MPFIELPENKTSTGGNLLSCRKAGTTTIDLFKATGDWVDVNMTEQVIHKKVIFNFYLRSELL